MRRSAPPPLRGSTFLVCLTCCCIAAATLFYSTSGAAYSAPVGPVLVATPALPTTMPATPPALTPRDEAEVTRLIETAQAAVGDDKQHGGEVASQTTGQLASYFPLLRRCAEAGEVVPPLTWSDVGAAVDADKEPFSASEIRTHLDRIFMLLDDPSAVRCYRRLATALLQHKPHGDAISTPAFLDLGSREIDSTAKFLKHYPSAQTFSIHCFEANPKYNPLYPPFSRTHPNVHYYNYAVGVENTTLRLSNRAVGSSIVAEAGAKGAAAVDSVEVPVIHFSGFLAHGLPPQIRPPSFVVMKMDIEKMEFAVLHQMLRTGTIFLLRELLLECHYTTNLPRERRNPKVHIGRDDCYGLARKLTTIFPSHSELAQPLPLPSGVVALLASESVLESVLWNSLSTTRKSSARYIDRHGRFYPT